MRRRATRTGRLLHRFPAAPALRACPWRAPTPGWARHGWPRKPGGARPARIPERPPARSPAWESDSGSSVRPAASPRATAPTEPSQRPQTPPPRPTAIDRGAPRRKIRPIRNPVSGPPAPRARRPCAGFAARGPSAGSAAPASPTPSARPRSPSAPPSPWPPAMPPACCREMPAARSAARKARTRRRKCRCARPPACHAIAPAPDTPACPR